MIFESVLSRSYKDVFPFYLKHVELYRQLSKMLSTVSSRLESIKILASYTHIDLQFLIDSLEGLDKIACKIVADSELSNLINELEQIFDVFQEIRYILGQEDKSGIEIKEAVKLFLTSFKCNGSLGEVYKIVEKRFRMYKNELYVAYDNKFVPRTNNDLEDFNNCLKRPIRKGQGKRESWFYVEHQGVSATYYHNILNAPHVVGGAEISWSSERTPLERIGVVEKISVSSIMKLINREYLYKSLVKNDKLYTVHRWTRKIFKQGLETCLNSLDSKWTSIMEVLMEEKKIIKGGKTSSS
ncbi:hypothetical protein LCGC14_2009800 [marine sediment metagenome]|uniref:Uncharacterized protein n=1 Tax=marine sediment metagenome TaxID=412755 RepID=A0A0F9F0M6_9ZZZZ|nr:hypothetical protein [bacterium]